MKMKNGKAIGTDNILAEVWDTIGMIRVTFLTRLLNEILQLKKMQDEWKMMSIRGQRLAHSYLW